MKYNISASKNERSSAAVGRFVLSVFGLIFLSFGLREFGWHEAPGVVGILCVMASLPFFGFAIFGSNAFIQSLYKRRGVPNKD